MGDQGWVTQSVLWSPANNLVALAYGGRTWTAVKIISTAYWTSWEFTLPDGSPIPEYTFLPEDWGEWLDMDTLLLTVGRGAAYIPLCSPCRRGCDHRQYHGANHRDFARQL